MKTRLKTLEQRIQEKVIRDENGCWIWTGSHSRSYGALMMGGQGGQTVVAHRVTYEFYRGPIPEGMVLDHLCKTRGCVNPDHLEAVTPAENNRRSGSPSALNIVKTSCPHGHPYSGDNLVITKRGYRRCRICMEESFRRADELIADDTASLTPKGLQYVAERQAKAERASARRTLAKLAVAAAKLAQAERLAGDPLAHQPPPHDW